MSPHHSAPFRLLLPAAAAIALAGAPGAVHAQTGALDAAPVAVAGPQGGASAIQQGWAEPFAVQSVGRPVGRGPRQVVVLAEPASAAPRVAAAAPTSTTAPAPASTPAPRTPAPAAPSPAPARSASAPAASTSSAKPVVAGTRTHRVEWGETWYGIAREYGVSPRDLSAANPSVDPERLRSGEVLRIPRAPAGATRRTHRVVAGETLWAISRRYGVSAAALRRANRMTDDKVRTGQLLVIPQEENR